MRFLTQAWHRGDVSDDEDAALLAAYHTHKNALLPQLPERLRTFYSTIDIHDALVRQMQLNRHAETLTLELRAGDVQTGYFDLQLRYDGVDLASLDVETLSAVASDTHAEALYHEIDLASPDRFVHSWLWWPYRELDIAFTAFDFSVTARASRDFDRPPAE